MKTGRNAPYPCGSGKKYKHCCLGKDRANGYGAHMQDFMARLRQAASEQEFESLEDARAFMQAFVTAHNQQPVQEFHGLSPDQVRRLLDAPFDSPEMVTFPEHIEPPPRAPILTLFTHLANGIGETSPKPTATGNLPRNLCREVAQECQGMYENRLVVPSEDIRSETDFFELHVTRVVAELAGLVRKYKGRFILSRQAKKLIGGSGDGAIYPLLLRAYAEKYNWAYADGYPELPRLQQTFPFMLYLLNRYSDTETEPGFYLTSTIEAFPILLEDVEPTEFESPLQLVARCFTLRIFNRFLSFLGLADIRATSSDITNRGYRIRKLPLFNAAVKFHI